MIGCSLLAACRFRLRRKHAAGWERASLELAPRSAYLLRGPSRTEWEHSIPPTDALRYSITFRSLAALQDHPPAVCQSESGRSVEAIAANRHRPATFSYTESQAKRVRSASPPLESLGVRCTRFSTMM